MAPVPEESVSPTPRSKIRARIRPRSRSSTRQKLTLVRFGKQPAAPLDRRADRRQVELLETLVDLDRALRVADRDVLELALGARRRRSCRGRPRARRGSRRSSVAARPIAIRAEPGPVRVGVISPAAVEIEKRVGVGPAGAAQVEDRLADAVAGELGLGAVGVEDPQRGHEARVARCGRAAGCRPSGSRSAAAQIACTRAGVSSNPNSSASSTM